MIYSVLEILIKILKNNHADWRTTAIGEYINGSTIRL